jgi:glutaminase
MISFLNNYYMDYASILLEIQEESNAQLNVTTTIPELAKVSPNKFGIHLTTIDGDDFELETVMKNSLFKVFQKATVVFAFSLG